MELKFKLQVVNDPVIDELEFNTLEELEAKVKELTPAEPEEEQASE